MSWASKEDRMGIPGTLRGLEVPTVTGSLGNRARLPVAGAQRAW